jgi:hypothetical protein
MKGSSKPTTQTVVNKTEIPGWLQSAMQGNIAEANKIAGQPYQAYNGQTVAGVSPTTFAGWNHAVGNIGAGQPTLNAATGLAALAGTTNVGQVTPGTFANGLSNLGAYTNPHTQQVVDAAMGDMRQQFNQGLDTINDRAVRSNAFGGSRMAVQEGVAASEFARNSGALSAQLRSQGFDKASDMLGKDIQTGAAAQVANQQSALEQIKARTAAALGMGQLAGQSQAMNLQDSQTLLGIGSQQQAQSQAHLDDSYRRFLEQRNHPIDMLNLRLGAVANTNYPFSSTSTSTGSSQSGNPLMGGLGGLMAGASLFGSGGALAGLGSSLGLSSGMTTGLGSLGLGLLGFMSDEKTKTDIVPLGKDPKTGLKVAAYRYKGDPKSYPKVVGPMAGEIEKKFPGMTRKIGGKRIVTGGNAMAGGL